MRIFKRKRGNSQSRCWYCEFKDHYDVKRRVALYGDKRAPEEAGRNLEKLVAYRKARRPLEGEVLAFVEGLDNELRGKLAEWPLLDWAQASASMPLMVVCRVRSRNGRPAYEVTDGHLAAYRDSMVARELAARHVQQVISHCSYIIDKCSFHHPSDIVAAEVEKELSALRQKEKAARTVNTYPIAFKSFCNWLTARM